MPKNKISDSQLREALISMITLTFIEENSLLTNEQLSEARASLQALFLRTTGEETMLRKLINILKTNKALNQAFNEISKILTGLSASVQVVEGKIEKLKLTVQELGINVEENAAFVGPFLDYAQAFSNKIHFFGENISRYIELKENEARWANHWHIAQQARSQLKKRLSSELADADGEKASAIEAKIRKEVMQSFDYGETETNFKYAQRESQAKEEEINGILLDLREMCQMAKKPEMREQSIDGKEIDPRNSKYQDVFVLFSKALKKHKILNEIKPHVIDLFKLFQHSYGIFSLDFENLQKAVKPMIESTDDYFEAKEEDQDIKVKRMKLKKIEAMIPFLEKAAKVLKDKDSEYQSYSKFSRKLSDMISEKKTTWYDISEDLLRIKVSAEAELSTRI